MSRARIHFVAALCALAVIGLISRAAYVCLVNADRYGERAARQALTELEIKGRRGDIVDRNGQHLAWSVPVASAYARRQFVSQPYQAAQGVAKAIGAEVSSVFTQLSGERGYVWLKRWLTEPEAAAIRQLREPGVALAEESRRYYPYRETAAHVVGFADHDERGLEGVERAFDDDLRGHPLTVKAIRDTRGRTFLKGGALPAHTAGGGHTLVLTIDAGLQWKAEDVLERAAVLAKAKGASAIVIEPSSGEILALASYPRFNPNTRGSETADARRARPVTDMFEPGSTMKPFTIATAIEAGLVAPETKLFCHLGQKTFGSGRWQHTVRDVKALGEATVAEVIKYSSNVCAGKIGEKLGKARLYDGLSRFFFGRKTNVELPGEAPGVLHELKRWKGSSVVTHSYGYGLSTTVVQLAQAYAALANDGEVVALRLAREVRDASGRVVRTFERQHRGRAVSPATARKVREMMAGVTEKGGTGRRAAIAGFRVAGKTGTALKPGHAGGGYSGAARRVLFAGMVPAQAPRLVAVVLFEEPEGKVTGGLVAAPAWQEIVESALQHLGVAPDRELLGKHEAIAAKTARAQGTQAVLASTHDEPRPTGNPRARHESGVPDLLGLGISSALRAATEHGLTLEIEGSGRAVRQEPAPGANVAPGAAVKVVFAREGG